jgi:GDP-D-mannose 3',5'-epimerase
MLDVDVWLWPPAAVSHRRRQRGSGKERPSAPSSYQRHCCRCLYTAHVLPGALSTPRSAATAVGTGRAMPEMRICVTGAGGFIGGHLCKRLKAEGHTVVGADWKRHEFFEESEICDVFHLVDLRRLENCLAATRGCDWVFNLAADMGGMGFIQSNNSVIIYNNTMISFNVTEASRVNGVRRLLYTSSACVYPEHIQRDVDNQGLAEADAWPAQPQDAYGLEKLYAEELHHHYARDFPQLQTRVARLHNVYGPCGTWKGGREKAPAAFVRKAIAAKAGDQISMWGDGEWLAAKRRCASPSH